MKNMYDMNPEYLQRKARKRQNILLLAIVVVIIVAVIWVVKTKGGDGYVGSWDAYGYRDILNIWSDGTYVYSWDDSSVSGKYEAFDKWDDIPDYYLNQINYWYSDISDSDVTWLVLLDESGQVYEIGFYDLEADEIRMGWLFGRSE